MLNLELLKNQVIEVAIEASTFIQSEAIKFSKTSVEYKALNNVVSYVDKATEELIVSRLAKILPEAGFITEEDTVENSDERGLNWIIDPLDGTAKFIHGLPYYSTSLALANGKDVLLGVIVNCSNADVYAAHKGGGAFVNKTQLKVSGAKTLSESLLSTGFPYYKFEKQDLYLKILESLMQKTHGLRRMGSAAIDLAYVARGFFDGFYEYNLNSYDMAAGVLLVQEAGGICTDFNGGDNYLFGGDIVAGAPVQAELLNEIKKFWV
jgi:myo-inositol-1(or 4)-monophosphatase